MSDTELKIITSLYEARAIKMIICSYKMCWELDLRANFVAILGVQRFEGQEGRFIDYTVPDMLQMMGKAGLPEEGEDSEARCFIYCPTPKKEFYKKFL